MRAFVYIMYGVMVMCALCIGTIIVVSAAGLFYGVTGVAIHQLIDSRIFLLMSVAIGGWPMMYFLDVLLRKCRYPLPKFRRPRPRVAIAADPHE